MLNYKKKIISKKNSVSGIYISKILVAPYTMVIITFVIFLSVYLGKVWIDFLFEILTHFSMATTVGKI